MAEQVKLLEDLLLYNLKKFALLYGSLEDVPAYYDIENAVKLLNWVEFLSRSNSNDDKEKCLIICGLLYEHHSPEWAAFSSFIIPILSRIGVSPSACMLKDVYEKESNQFSSLGSLFEELRVTMAHMKTEVSYKNGKTILLSQFQKDLWEKMDSETRLGVSAPTSAGKSFVLVQKVIDKLIEVDGEILYIVPTLSLVGQVTNDLKDAALAQGLKGVHIAQMHSPTHAVGLAKSVYVLTQERALSALSQPDSLGNLILAIVDEVQNVERMAGDDDERSSILLQVIRILEEDRKVPQMVVSGPRLQNLQELTDTLLCAGSETVKSDLPPVVNVTYALSKGKAGRVRLTQYIAPHLPNVIVEFVPYDPSWIRSFGGKQYKTEINHLIDTLALPLANQSGVIIFSPTSTQAAHSAMSLTEYREQEEDSRLDALAAFITESIHPNYSLKYTVPYRIGIHHGKMPPHARLAVEKAFLDGALTTIVCTTTLMQGVNLPAKNIIIRNPYLYINKSSERELGILTDYEVSNLKGRAGRLMKDFLGRSILLDENSFVDNKIDLSKQAEKTVAVSLVDRFEANRKTIMNCLLSGQDATELKRNGDIVTRIRHNVVKYEAGSQSRLRNIGLSISQEELGMVQASLTELMVPKAIVVANPNWDAINLNAIFLRRREYLPFPAHPFDDRFVYNLKNNLELLRVMSFYYFEKYLGRPNERRLLGILISASKWAKEVRLKDVICWETADYFGLDSKTIDQRVQTLTGTVSFSLCKVLRPLSMMLDPENGILTNIEMGAYRQETKRLIELGLPREIAINAVNYFSPKPKAEIWTDARLYTALNGYAAIANYWEKRIILDITKS